MRRLLSMLCVGLIFSGASAARASLEEGLFATFITSRGNFTVLLEHEKAPVTVANFVGLAEGTRFWLDEKKGALVGRPFYNGLTFQRVEPGFVIQIDSPNGLGSNGPGYIFGDEFHPSLLHVDAGILSMTNNGADTNGGRFFITLGATPWFDSRHSVFGRVVEGMSVVYAIGSGESGETLIERVEISRLGSSAQAFDARESRGLPEWKTTSNRWAGGWALEVERGPFTEHRFLGTENLQTWSELGVLTDLAAPGAGPVDVSQFVAGRSKYFLRAAKLQYALRPASFLGRTIALRFTSGGENLTITMGSEPDLEFGGTFILDQGDPQDVRDVELEHLAAATRLSVELSGVGSFIFSLKFRTPTEGWFTAQGIGDADGFWPLFGTFIFPP